MTDEKSVIDSTQNKLTTGGNPSGRPPTQGAATEELPSETTSKELGSEQCKRTTTTPVEAEEELRSEDRKKTFEKEKTEGVITAPIGEQGPGTTTDEPPTKQSTTQVAEDKSSSSSASNEPASEVNRLQINFYGI